MSYDREVLQRKREFAEALAAQLESVKLPEGRVVAGGFFGGLQLFVTIDYPDGKRETFGIKVSGRAG